MTAPPTARKSAPAWGRIRTGRIYLTENAKAANIVAQRTSLMVPASFSPPIPKAKIHK